LGNRFLALLVETLQRHPHGLLGHCPIRAFDCRQRGNELRRQLLAVIQADQRQIGWNADACVRGGKDCADR
jgi:hypothetical protein